MTNYRKLISKYSNFYNYVKAYRKLNRKKGIYNANCRTRILETLISKVYNMIISIFSIKEDLNLLFRGSFAHCLTTSVSDVDFEISNSKYTNGYYGMEKIIIDFLNILDLKSEGSSERPQEKDLVSTSGLLTRDIYEFWELRQLGSFVNNGGWLNDKFNVNINEHLPVPSEYEKKEHKLCPKILFFEIRTCIVKLARKHKINYANILLQLDALKLYIDPKLHHSLYKALQRSVYYYENNITENKKLFLLKKQIDTIKNHFKIYKINLNTEVANDK